MVFKEKQIILGHINIQPWEITYNKNSTIKNEAKIFYFKLSIVWSNGFNQHNKIKLAPGPCFKETKKINTTFNIRINKTEFKPLKN